MGRADGRDTGSRPFAALLTRVELSKTLYLDKNRYAIRGDASFSTYTATANIPALRAGNDASKVSGHTSGGDDEKERVHVMPKLLAVLYTPRALHTSLVSFHSTRRAGWPALQAKMIAASAE